jgi:hypothetical protein
MDKNGVRGLDDQQSMDYFLNESHGFLLSTAGLT